jgi:hypothetical protein
MKTFLKKNLILILIMAIVLSLNITSESWAEDVTIVDSGNCGINGADNCQWSLDSKGKLTVTGSGATDNYSYTPYYNSPWSDYRDDIFSVEVSGISTIGVGAFGHLSNLKDVYMDDSVTKLGIDAFWFSPIETLRMSDAITTIDQAAFQGNHLTSIIVPDTAIINHTSFGGNPELQIICKGSQETCAGLMKQMQKYSMHTNEGDSIVNLSNNVHLANYTNCNSSKYFWDGAKCVREPDVTKRKCCASCKDMGGWCNRIRYTPAEAAEVLKDDNNEIVITFRK